MKTNTQPQIVPEAEIEDQMRSVAGDLLSEKIVPEDLRGEVEVVVNPDGVLSISRCYLEDQDFEEYLEWVRSTPEISESVRWDDVILPNDYRVPRGILTEMVRSTEPYRKMHQLPKSRILSHAVKIYYLMRGELRSEEFCSFIGCALARTNHPDLEKVCGQLEENIRGAVGQTLESRPDGSNVVEITLDGTWLKVLNLIHSYGIAEATLARDGDMLTLEGMEGSRGVLVRAELQGPVAGNSELEKLGISAETLFKTLKVFDTPCRVEVRRENGEMRVCSLDPSRIDSSLPVERTLPVKKPAQGVLLDLDTEHSVEAESVELDFRLRYAMKAHGVDGFQATIAADDGKLLLDYWTEDSTDGLKSILGEAQGDEASSTYSPELLEPLEGEWNLKLSADLPLRAEKAIEKGEGGWEANVTVIVPQK